MTQIIDFDALCKELSGTALIRGDTGYDEARSAWNGEIDRYPALIARCANAADVAAAIGYARSSGLELSVRGGFHGTAGHAICDDGVMIDLSQMCAVEVDPVARRARVGGGATLADLDAATQEHGLAVPAGIISHTGVGGLALGGGLGWLTPLYGLTADNLVSAQVVTADGRTLRAAADEHPDLYWALRGGGGNFGVVTEFEFQLHQVGPLVHVGLLFWTADQGAEVLRLGRDVFATLPANANAMIISTGVPPAPFVPEQYHFTPSYALAVIGFGSAEEHAGLLAPIREALAPLFEFVTPMPYTQLQRMFDDGPWWGIRCYEKALYLDGLSDDAIAVITQHQARKASPRSLLELYRLGGAYARSARTRQPSVAAVATARASSSSGSPQTPSRCLPNVAGSGRSGTRCVPMPPAQVAISTQWPKRMTIGSEPRTVRPSTNGWPGSRPYTTRTTSFIATPTSNLRCSRPDACRVVIQLPVVVPCRQVVVV